MGGWVGCGGGRREEGEEEGVQRHFDTVGSALHNIHKRRQSKRAHTHFHDLRGFARFWGRRPRRCHSSDHTSALRHHQELNLQVPGQRQETGRTHPRARGVVHGHRVADSRLVGSLLPLAVERLLLVLHVGEPRDAAQRARAGQIEEDSECEAERAVLLVLISASSTPPQPPRNCGGSLDAALAIQASHQPPIVVCGVGCVVCVGGVVVGGGGREGRRGFCCDVTEMCVSISLHSCTESWGHVPVDMAPRPCASHKAPKTTPSTWSPVVATRRARRTRMNA